MTTQPQALATLDPQSLIAGALEKGASVETVERLVALAERMQALRARQEWVSSMTQAQQGFPTIEKTKEGKTSSYTYAYAPLDEIDQAIKPVLHKHDLVMTWQYDSRRPGEVGANCRITHALGHFEDSGFFYVPIEPAREDGKGATPAQRAGIAATYARRYSCCAIGGLVPHGEDVDGKDPQGATAEAVFVPREDGSLLVTDVQEIKGGKPGQRAWTRYDVHFDDGSRAATFDEALGKAARQAKTDGALMAVLVEKTTKGVSLTSLMPVEAPGPVQDALAGFAKEVEGAPDTALERQLLNSQVVALGNKLKLKSAERALAWETHVGEFGPDDAPVEKLSDLVRWLKARAGE